MSPRRANRISQATKPYDDSRGRKSWHANAFQPHSAAQLSGKRIMSPKMSVRDKIGRQTITYVAKNVILRHYSLAQSNEAQ
jgi:hypothetical protein